MKKDSQKLYQESFEFICQNFNITSDQIPYHLLQYSISPDIETQPYGNSESPSQLGVFMMAYSAYKARKCMATLLIEYLYKTDMKYQYVLSIEYLHRKINIGFVPLGVFNIT